MPASCADTHSLGRQVAVPMTHNLFVYGTLMSAADSRLGRRERMRLAASGRSLGNARTRGRLFDLGAYPGLVVASGRSVPEFVHGEVFALDRPEETFAWLDPYEGIGPAASGDAEFVRVIREIWLAETVISAWLYLYRGTLPADGLIADGRWPGAAQAHP